MFDYFKAKNKLLAPTLAEHLAARQAEMHRVDGSPEHYEAALTTRVAQAMAKALKEQGLTPIEQELSLGRMLDGIATKTRRAMKERTN